MTRIGIMAAGAIGSVVGGMFALADHNVRLIDQGASARRPIKRDGLRLSGTWGPDSSGTIAVAKDLAVLC